MKPIAHFKNGFNERVEAACDLIIEKFEFALEREWRPNCAAPGGYPELAARVTLEAPVTQEVLFRLRERCNAAGFNLANWHDGVTFELSEKAV